MMPDFPDQHRNPSLKIRSFPLNALFVLALFYTAYFASSIVLPVTLALFFAFLLRPLVRLLKRVWIPDIAGAALVLIFVLAMAGFGIANLSEPALDWIDKAPGAFEQMGKKLKKIMAPFQRATRSAEQLGNMADEKARHLTVRPGPTLAQKFVARISEFIAQGAVMIILLFFILASGDLFIIKFMSLYPSPEKKRQIAEFMREIEGAISRYLLTVTLVNIAEGTLVGLGMYLIGMPDPLLWGVMAALLVFIPYLGPLVGIAIVTIVALSTLPDIRTALLAPFIYFCITSLQGQFLTPLILGMRFKMNPVAIFLSLILWGAIWGVIGALVAVPMLTIFKIICDRIQSLKIVSEFLSR